MPKKKISFEEWINKEGVEELARIFRVDPATIRHWRAGRCFPRVEQMKRIKHLTKGAVDYEQIIDRIEGATS